MSLVPARQNFTIYQGATFTKLITYKIGGVVQNLTGYDAELIIKDEPEGDVLLTLNTSNGGIEISGAEGLILLNIEVADTADPLWDVGVYELFIETPGGQRDVLLYGTFKVRPF